MARCADVRSQTYPSPEYLVIEDTSSADVDLVTSRPGYASSLQPLACRAIYCPTDGTVVLRLNDAATAAGGTAVTITVTAGTYLPVQAVAVEATGSTVTSMLVMY